MITRGMTFEIFDKIIDAVIMAESSGNPNAISPVGAKGLMQLMDNTAHEVLIDLGFEPSAYNPFNAKQNKLLGSTYLKDLLNLFGEVKIALAAYNFGSGNVSKLVRKYGEFYSRIEPELPDETKNYVTKITKRLAADGVIA